MLIIFNMKTGWELLLQIERMEWNQGDRYRKTSALMFNCLKNLKQT